jgi:hypothetical protein
MTFYLAWSQGKYTITTDQAAVMFAATHSTALPASCSSTGGSEPRTSSHLHRRRGRYPSHPNLHCCCAGMPGMMMMPGMMGPPGMMPGMMPPGMMPGMPGMMGP